MKTKCFAWTVILSFWTAWAMGSEPAAEAQPRPVVGGPAPPLLLSQLLQSPEGAEWSWESLRGNVVVLEFWHTGCGPCIALFPYLAKVKEALADEPIVFISITYEEEPEVQSFLKKRTIPGWIGLDDRERTHRAYGVRHWPAAGIVGKDGLFLGWAPPTTLAEDSKLLRAVLRGESVPLRDTLDGAMRRDGEPVIDLSPVAEESICLVQIGPPRPGGSELPSSHIYQNRAVSLSWAVAETLGVPAPYLEWRADADAEAQIAIMVRGCSKNRNVALGLVRAVLETTFQLRIAEEEKSRDVLILKLCGSGAPNWEPALMRLKVDPDAGLIAPNAEVLERRKAGEKFFIALGSTAELAAHLSYAVKRPVIDEANVEGYYHFYFPLDMEKDPPEKAIQAIREKYDLCLSPEQRPVRVFVVENAHP